MFDLKKNRNLIIKIISYIFLFITIFLYGYSVSKYRVFPAKYLSEVKEGFMNLVGKQKKPLNHLRIDRFNELDGNFFIYDFVDDIPKLEKVNNDIFISVNMFNNIFQKINIIDSEEIILKNSKTNIVKINYKINNKKYSAFAYGILPNLCKKNVSSLIIPGSGQNISNKIIQNDINNHHFGIYNLLNKKIKFNYVFIKPNQDALAWRSNKNQKVHEKEYIYWHNNRGGSYSLSYISQSIAFHKWMKTCFNKTILVGLSQGGSAVLINSINSNPDYAIISSGYSSIKNKNNFKEINESDLVLKRLSNVPNFYELTELDELYKILYSSETKWFFSWGKNDVGRFREEAIQRKTANKIEKLNNVTTVIHDGGHNFPLTDIDEFLSSTN